MQNFFIFLFHVLQCCTVLFTGTDLDNAADVVYEDLAVSDMTGIKSFFHNINHTLNRNL